MNTYGYVGGNPVNFVDPDGLRIRRGGSGRSSPHQRQINRSVRSYVRSINQFNPSFKYVTARAQGSTGRYNRNDVQNLQSLLQAYQSAGICYAPGQSPFRLSRKNEEHAASRNPNGTPTRPFLNSPRTIADIILGSSPRPDSRGAQGAWSWNTPGRFGGSSGNWELVIGPNGTVYHMNFVGTRNSNNQGCGSCSSQ